MKWSVAAVLAVMLASLLIWTSTPSDRWVRHDVLDSTGSVLTLNADAPVRGWTRSAVPTLTVRCHRGEVPGVLLATRLPLEVENGDERSVSIQFDSGPSVVRHWAVSADRQVLTAPAAEARELVERMAAAETVEFGFVPMRAEPVFGRFSVRGFERHWETTRSYCS